MIREVPLPFCHRISIQSSFFNFHHCQRKIRRSNGRISETETELPTKPFPLPHCRHGAGYAKFLPPLGLLGVLQNFGPLCHAPPSVPSSKYKHIPLSCHLLAMLCGVPGLPSLPAEKKLTGCFCPGFYLCFLSLSEAQPISV